MFCEKCGVKNEVGVKFCSACGNKMSEVIKTKAKIKNNKIENIWTSFKKLPKKLKIIYSLILVLIFGGLCTLIMFLNNPVRIITSELENYYETGNKKSLNKIGDLLVKNKKKSDVLSKIKNSSHKEIYSWVEDFNKEYTGMDTLYENYNDIVLEKIEAIYDKYNGLEYIMSEEYYDELTKELKYLYTSKYNYFVGQESENNDDLLEAYKYYIKVVEEDCYYDKAQEFVNDYIKDHIKEFENEAKKVVNDLNPTTDEEIKNAYSKQLEFLYYNETYNGLDISNTDSYKKLLSDAKKIVVEKLIALVKGLDTINDGSTNLEKYNVYLDQIDYLSNNYYVAGIDLNTVEDYKKMYNEISKKLYDMSLVVASDYKNAYDYDKSIEVLEDVQDYMASDTTYYSELDKLINEYEANKPVEIVSLDHFEPSYQIYKTTIDSTINEVKYNSYLRFGFDGENEHMSFNVEKKYTRFRAEIVRPDDWEKNQKGTIVIYGDGKELYKSTTITASNKFDGMIDIDITGVSTLKVELKTTYNSRKGMFNYLEYIYVVNGLLYK